MNSAKTSIFLFFLIIGTSVFPNGGSGLAYAKPFNPLAALGAISTGLDIIKNIVPGGGQNSEGKPTVGEVHGIYSNQDMKNTHYNNVDGSIVYRRTLQQNNNLYQNSYNNGDY